MRVHLLSREPPCWHMAVRKNSKLRSAANTELYLTSTFSRDQVSLGKALLAVPRRVERLALRKLPSRSSKLRYKEGLRSSFRASPQEHKRWGLGNPVSMREASALAVLAGRFKVAAAGARGQAGPGLCHLISSWGMMHVVPQNREWTCMAGLSGLAELLTLHQLWKAWHPILRAGTPFPKTPKP